MPNPDVYPRPEYPRPDRQRGTVEGFDWLNLNGPWQFRFDRDRRGLEERWYLPDGLEWREQIIVPFCWESLAAWGEGDAAGNQNYYSTRVFLNPLEVDRSNHRAAPRYEVGWYRREVAIPKNDAWAGKRVILTVGAADFFTDGWCNGTGLGHHEGGYTPFEFDLTDALVEQPDGERRGLLVLRVEDPMDNHEQPVGKQWKWYTTTSGIWQAVFLEPRSAAHIDSFRIHSDIDRGEASFVVNCLHTAGSARVRVEATIDSGEVVAGEFPVRDSVACGALRIPGPKLWNPNDPFLYRTRLFLRADGRELDSVRTYFGMRKIDTTAVDDAKEPALLRLNGLVRYLRGALYQSYYPEGVYTAGNVHTLKNDILFAKKAGFNFLRIHIKIDDPLILYYADLLGMLVMADFPNFGEGGDTPVGRRRFEEMMREAIRRDYNHPSIFAWCLFNETWGFGGQVEFVNLFTQPPREMRRDEKAGVSAAALSARDASVSNAVSAEAEAPVSAPAPESEKKARLANLAAHSWVQQMWSLAKQLDPTRLIEDMSVVHWEHLDYFAHGDTDINSWHFYINDYTRAKEHIEKVVRATYAGSSFNYVEGFHQQCQPLINSEYGGVGALDGDRDTSWSFKFLTNELRRHEKISAYIYTELHDVEWEFNGFLNYDRTQKDFGYDPTIINESDVLPIDFPPILRCQPGGMIRVPVSSSHYSTHHHEDVTLRWRLAGMDTRGHIAHDLAKGSAPIDFPHRRVALAKEIELTMPARSMLCTLSIQAIKSDGATVARNFCHFLVSDGYPVSREENPRWLALRCAPADWVASEWSCLTGDRDEARFEDRCFGATAGFFEWAFPLGGADLSRARRIRVLCEVSSRRMDSPQTDDDTFATTLLMLLNGVPVYRATIPNHPHDARGVLSYLRGGRGAHGYLAHATAEGELLRQIIEKTESDALRLRCLVPADAIAQGGLTVYGAECGRYPVAPTLVVEW